MQIRSIRFVKRFVLFTTVTKLNNNQLVVEKEQYHIDFGQHHKVRSFEHVSENSVFIEFADGDSLKGSATIDKAFVELLGGGTRLPDPCCDKG